MASDPALYPSYDDGRARERRSISIKAYLTSSATGRLAVTITDLSETGCQVARSARLVEGSFITLVMPGLSAIGAQVMWGSASSIGLRFERPLHSSVVEHVARTAR